MILATIKSIASMINARFIMVAFMFILCDIGTGFVSAIATNSFKSKIMREGGKHKVLLLSVIAFGVVLDVAQHMVDMGFNIPATTAICGYITLMEIMSCLENINKGFPGALPKILTKTLSNAANEAGVGNEDINEQ